jgi:hypothetical protein
MLGTWRTVLLGRGRGGGLHWPILQGRGSVAEPKLFVLAAAPAPTFKKFPLRLWLRLELCGYLFSQLLNEKVDFSRLLGKIYDLIHYFM